MWADFFFSFTEMAEKRKSLRLNPDVEPEVVDVDVPAGASLLFKAGLVSYDAARLIDDRAFQLENNSFQEGPGLNTKVWRSGNRLHREFDQPAVIGRSGTKMWYRRGQLHRNYKKGPALIDPFLNRTQYFHRGKLHNPEGPAHIGIDSKEYFDNGIRHRIGGPAIEFFGDKEGAPALYYVYGRSFGTEPPSEELLRKHFGASHPELFLTPHSRMWPTPSPAASSSASSSFEPPTKKRKKE